MERENKLIITEEVRAVIDRRLAELKIEIGAMVSGEPTYEQLCYIHSYIRRRFVYTPDERRFFNPKTGEGYTDYHSTQAYENLMYYGTLYDDCDGFGACMLELSNKLGVDRRRLRRTSCQTETGEGHYVAHIRANDGIWYQCENRGKVASIKYYKDMGYTYWKTSRLDTLDKAWKDADRFIAMAIYNTPNNLESDTSEFKVSKMFALSKSKTLVKEWGSTAIGIIGVSAPVLQANAPYLHQLLTERNVAIVLLVSSLIGVYLRTVTNKDVEAKKNYDY